MNDTSPLNTVLYFRRPGICFRSSTKYKILVLAKTIDCSAEVLLKSFWNRRVISEYGKQKSVHRIRRSKSIP